MGKKKKTFSVSNFDRLPAIMYNGCSRWRWSRRLNVFTPPDDSFHMTRRTVNKKKKPDKNYYYYYYYNVILFVVINIRLNYRVLYGLKYEKIWLGFHHYIPATSPDHGYTENKLEPSIIFCLSFVVLKYFWNRIGRVDSKSDTISHIILLNTSQNFVVSVCSHVICKLDELCYIVRGFAALS